MVAVKHLLAHVMSMIESVVHSHIDGGAHLRLDRIPCGLRLQMGSSVSRHNAVSTAVVTTATGMHPPEARRAARPRNRGRGCAGGVTALVTWGLLLRWCASNLPPAAMLCRPVPPTRGACWPPRTRLRTLALRGGAWISEEVDDDAQVRVDGNAMGPAGPASRQTAADGLAAEDNSLDDFVERCAAAALQTGGGQGVVPTDMPYEDFVWTREFAEQGFDPLFMLGMTEEQAEIARKEWVSRVMDGEDDIDQLCEVAR